MSYQKELLGNTKLIMIFASHSKKRQCAKGFIWHFPTHARAILYSNFIIDRYCQVLRVDINTSTKGRKSVRGKMPVEKTNSIPNKDKNTKRLLR